MASALRIEMCNSDSKNIECYKFEDDKPSHPTPAGQRKSCYTGKDMSCGPWVFDIFFDISNN